MIAEYISALRWHECYPDPESPSGIEVLNKKGINVKEVVKGKDSIRNGINVVRELFKQNRLFIHKDSVNLIWELETYSYPEKKPDKNEEENPIKENDHALDALRYALYMKANEKKKTVHIYKPTTNTAKPSYGFAGRFN
jgi:phage terminase large subunit